MATSSETTEESRRALGTACARALARRADLPVVYGHDADAAAPHLAVRARADAAACRLRFALPPTALSLRPTGFSGALFDALTDARADALGARWLRGIAGNFARCPSHAGGPLAAWTFALIQGEAVPGCPEHLAPSLAPLVALVDHPFEYARAAQGIALELAVDFPAADAGCGNADAAAGVEMGARPSAEAGADIDKLLAEHPEGTAPMGEESGQESLSGASPPPLPEALCRDYRIYTTRYDRVVAAADLATSDELERLRAQLDADSAPFRPLVTRLAHRLQRLLLARQRRYWSHDLEEGGLDPSRLARLVADPSRAQVFRREMEAPFRQAAVTLLLDNSGSMRGRPIAIAALTADLLARALERCGVKLEILGYTSADWEGGTPARDWAAAGSPTQPGRLNALRLIVYKAMEAPWRRARRDLGLMLKADLLKENIDGEALHWAAWRLAARTEPRRLLIVVSDGAPMDKATLAANSRDYLDRHLRQAVDWVERNTDIELRAIGIGHPVGRYYRQAVQLRSADELATVLPMRLGEWLA